VSQIQSYNEATDLNLPPGRMNATRAPPRLTPSSPLQNPTSFPMMMRRRSMEGTRSRSRSPLHTATTKETQALTDGNSSISSLDEFVDQDILYDRQGLVELDLTESQRKLHNSREFVNLPPVNERLSEDTLEDVHAFSDVVRSSNASRVSGGTGTDAMLEPLDEGEEDDELDDIDEEGSESDPMTTVILTNMENLTLVDEDNPRHLRDISRTGESSLVEESPSAPTA